MNQIEMPGIVEVGEVSTLAGSTQGFADGVGSTAQFSSPKGVAVDSAGIVYVADTNNHKIRKILPDGTVSTLAGSTQGYADGVGAAAQFSHPEYIAVTGDGIVYVLKSDYEPPWCIRKILPNGTVSTLVRLERPPQSIALDSNGHIYFGQDGRMKKILPDGTIILLREIPYKSRLTIGHDGIIYIVDIKDNEIVKILKDGTKHTLVSVDTNFVGGPIAVQRIFDPHSITVDNTGNLYITDSNRIRKIAPDGTLTTLAGMKKGFTDGRGSEARFSSPQGIAVDSTGVVYIADTSNNRIRKMVIGRFEGTNENVPPSAPSGFGSSARSAATSARSAASGFGSSGSSGSSGFGPSGFSGFGPSASAPSAPSAPSGSSVAAYSNFEGNGLSSETRGRLWWQLNQMTCPTREADSHIPFVKAQLNLLYKTAVKTVDSYTDKTTPDQMKIYQEYLRNIFTGVQASFTSLNNTSVKCAMLFTKMLVDHPLPDGLKERDLYSERGEYWDVNWDKPHTTPLAQRQLRGLVFQDEHPGCIPNCKNKGIVVLLGEMSLYELIWSYANDLYFIGLPTGITYADNDVHTPLTFVEHDCEHMEHRADIDEVFSHPSFVPEFKRAELQRRKDRAKENKNILKCLQYIRDKSKNTQDAVLLFLFVIVHEQNTQDILDDHVSLELFPVGLLQSISNRLQWKNDMGGLLPPEFKKPDDESNDDESNDDESNDDESNDDDDEAELDAAVLTWVKAQLVIFVDTWNASLASDAVAINERPNANTVARYDARTKANAAEWNARGGRITRRKRTARRKTQKHRRVTN